MLNDGKDVADVWRELQVSEQSYYWLRNPVRRDEARRRQAA
jgi:hypothetical protein